MITLIATLKVKERKMEEAIKVLKRGCSESQSQRTGLSGIYSAHLCAAMKQQLFFMRNTATRMH